MIDNCFFKCECSDGVYTVTAGKKGKYTAFISYTPDGFFPGAEYYEFEGSFEFRNREKHRPYFFIIDGRGHCFITAEKRVPVGEGRYFTDLGLLELRSGRGYIRPGKLYIADELTPDMATVEAVRELGIQTIIDLSDSKDEGYVVDLQYDGVRMLPADPDMYGEVNMLMDICFGELSQGRRILVHSGPGGEDPKAFMDRIIRMLEADETEGTIGSTAVPLDIQQIWDSYLVGFSDDTVIGEGI